MLYCLIKRGQRPGWHKAPYHEVLVCDRKKFAQREAGWTGDGATVWSADGLDSCGGGWLLERWNGFDIDYGHVVRSLDLPDGTKAAFWRPYESVLSVKNLFDGAIWYSDRVMPEWFEKMGVRYPPDEFTQQHILDYLAKDGASGFGREIPDHWPAPLRAA